MKLGKEQLLTKFFIAFQNFRFFPPGHTLAENSILDFYNTLEEQLANKSDITLGLIEENLTINGEKVFDSKDIPPDLKHSLHILNIDSICFFNGITVNEIKELLKLITTKPETLKNLINTHKEPLLQELTHIKINYIKYGKIEGKDYPQAKLKETKKVFISDELKDTAENFLRALHKLNKSIEVHEETRTSPEQYREVFNSLTESQKRAVEAVIQEKINEVTQSLTQKNKQLASEVEKLGSIIRNLGDGVVAIDSSGKILMLNPAAEKLLGKKAETLIGDVLKGKIGEEHLIILSKEKSIQNNFNEIEFISKSEDTKKILRSSNAVIQDKDGKTIGIVAVLSDITKIKELEELKSKFLANVSHELRSPLVAIKKNIQILLENQESIPTKEKTEFLKLALENVERLTSLINDLLDISAIEAGKMQFVFKKSNISQTIRKVVEMFSTWIREKEIEFILEIPKEEIEIICDENRFTQIVTNLMSNALKFTPNKGKIKLILTKKENIIELSLSDTGVGISKDNLKKIFDRFAQFSAPIGTGNYGTGLGLAIVKEIVEKHQGSIEVRSELGKGSNFIVKLPINLNQEEEQKNNGK